MLDPGSGLRASNNCSQQGKLRAAAASPPAWAAQACISTLEEALESCERIGYPIMLKASWGGGGKGIRKVRLPSCGRADMCLHVPLKSVRPAP